MTDDQKLRKRVGWLNKAGGFNNRLLYNKLSEAVQFADASIDDVLVVLKRLEEKGPSGCKDPTAYVTAALRKTSNGSRGAPNASFGAAASYNFAAPVDEADAKIRKRIGYLNRNGGFENSILYNKVMEAAGGLDVTEVLYVLKLAEEKKNELSDPNSWICSGLRKRAVKAGAVGQAIPDGGGYGNLSNIPEAANDEIDQKLRKRIGWLNQQGGFNNQINYNKVYEALASVGGDYTTIMRLLKTLEENSAEVRDPTAYLTSALRKNAPTNPYLTSLGGGADDSALRKRIGWLNKNGFENVINYQKIAVAAEQSGADTQSVLTVLKHLEENKADVKDATAYATKGIRKAGARLWEGAGKTPGKPTSIRKVAGKTGNKTVKKSIKKKQDGPILD